MPFHKSRSAKETDSHILRAKADRTKWYLQLLKLAAEEPVERVEALLQERLTGLAQWGSTHVQDQLTWYPQKRLMCA